MKWYRVCLIFATIFLVFGTNLGVEGLKRRPSSTSSSGSSSGGGHGGGHHGTSGSGHGGGHHGTSGSGHGGGHHDPSGSGHGGSMRPNRPHNGPGPYRNHGNFTQNSTSNIHHQGYPSMRHGNSSRGYQNQIPGLFDENCGYRRVDKSLWIDQLKAIDQHKNCTSFNITRVFVRNTDEFVAEVFCNETIKIIEFGRGKNVTFVQTYAEKPGFIKNMRNNTMGGWSPLRPDPKFNKMLMENINKHKNQTNCTMGPRNCYSQVVNGLNIICEHRCPNASNHNSTDYKKFYISATEYTAKMRPTLRPHAKKFIETTSKNYTQNLFNKSVNVGAYLKNHCNWTNIEKSEVKNSSFYMMKDDNSLHVLTVTTAPENSIDSFHSKVFLVIMNPSVDETVPYLMMPPFPMKGHAMHAVSMIQSGSIRMQGGHH